jgi:hypothetical protein
MECDEDLRWWGNILRVLMVGGMYLIALLAAGVGFLKTIAITVSMLTIMASSLGWRWIQRLGVAAFALVLLDWSGLVPVERWCHGIFAMIDKFFA